MRAIKIGSYESLVDDDVYEELEGRTFRTILPPSRSRYALLKLGKKKWVSLSRVVLCAPDNMMVDHINHDTLDNRRENLRLCDNRQNQGNRNKSSRPASSKYKGVCWYKRDSLWIATMKQNRKTVNLGRFGTEEEAAIAYNKAALDFFGEFAKLNEVPE